MKLRNEMAFTIVLQVSFAGQGFLEDCAAQPKSFALIVPPVRRLIFKAITVSTMIKDVQSKC